MRNRARVPKRAHAAAATGHYRKLHRQCACHSVQRVANVRIEQTQLRIECCLTRTQSERELQQPRHSRSRLGVPDVRLHTTHCQRLLTSGEHRSDQRSRLDWIAKRCACAVRLIERERVDTSARILQRSDEQALQNFIVAVISALREARAARS